MPDRSYTTWKYTFSFPEIEEAMTVLEEFANDPEKYEYYRARHNIQLKEQSVESEYRQIREDYEQAVEQRNTAFEARDQETELKEQALAENHQLKVTLAKTLLEAKNMDISQTSEITELSVEEISKFV